MGQAKSADRDDEPAAETQRDPVAQAILDCLAELPGRNMSPEQVARHVAAGRARPGDGPERSGQAWRRYFRAVKDQAFHLARRGEIEIVRKGSAVPPEDLRDLKGVWRMRLPGAG